VLPCSDKSKLIHALEYMVDTDTDHAHQQEPPDESTHSTTSDADHCQKIAVVDVMVLVQKLSKEAAAAVIITSAAGHTRSNRDEGPFPDNNHDEADTLMICLGVSATERNSVDAQITFFSRDTDVLVLIIANYDRLLKNTSISMASSVQQTNPLWTALGPDRAKALPGLHAFSGGDNTGRFARIGKSTWLKLFMEAEQDVIKALCTLCDDVDVSDDLQLTLAQFVYTACRPKGIQLSSIPELRWHLFCKYMAESEKLPPTLGALKQHILRARVQARV